MPPDPSFDELIRRVGSGDEEAAARLVRDFQNQSIEAGRPRPVSGTAVRGPEFPTRSTSVSRCSSSSSCAPPPASTT